MLRTQGEASMRTAAADGQEALRPRAGRNGGRGPAAWRDERRRGVAFVIALGVLTALFLMAVPFAVFMRMQHRSGTQAMQMARARYAETAARNHARNLLHWGVYQVEEDTAAAADDPFTNPDVDTLHEFAPTPLAELTQPVPGPGVAPYTVEVRGSLGFPHDNDPNTVDGFVRVDDEWMAYSDFIFLPPGSPDPRLGRLSVAGDAHRGLLGSYAVAHDTPAIVTLFPPEELWALDVKDEQAKINVNTAPTVVVANLLGYLGIGGSPPALPGAAGFPDMRQVAIAAAITAYRTNAAYWLGEDTGQYTPFQNVSMLKSISLARDPGGTSFWDAVGEDPLTGPELDRLRPYVTVSSSFAREADLWRGPQALEDDIRGSPSGGATDRSAANLDDASRATIGSVVRFRWTNPTSGKAYREYKTILTRNISNPASSRTLTENVLPSDSSLFVNNADGWIGASASTPGYVRIDNEWVEYTAIVKDVNDPSGDLADRIDVAPGGRGVFNTSKAAHAETTAFDGDVITWGSAWGLSWPLARDYSATTSPPEIDVENRHYVNINTVTDPVVLQSVLFGISNGIDYVDAVEARQFALNLLAQTSGGNVPAPPTVPAPASYEPPYEFFDGDEGWFVSRLELNTFLGDVGDAFPTPLSTDKEDMIRENFDADAPDLWPDISTVPLGFNSGTLVGLDTLGAVDDRARTPVAHSPRSDGLKLGRVYDIMLPVEPIWWLLRSQKDFVDRVTAGSSSNVNTALLNEGLGEPALLADSTRRYTSKAPGIGSWTAPAGVLRARPHTTLLEGLQETPPDFDADYAGGTAAEQTAVAATTLNTTHDGFTGVQLRYKTDYDQAAGVRNIEADSFHMAAQPFAVEFWMKPGDDLTSRQVLVDIGAGAAPADGIEDARNQVRVYLEDGRVVLRLDDQISDAGSPPAYGGHVIARSSSDFPLESDVWHHFALAVVGTFRDEIAMFIDGVYDRNMEWRYNYVNAGGVLATENNATVVDDYFWPIAMTVPNAATALAVNVPIGATVLTLIANIGLPADGGMIVVRRSSDSTDYVYRYASASGTSVTLAAPLPRTHMLGDSVASMIPLAQADVHWTGATKQAPAVADVPVLWGHTDTGSGSSYNADDPSSVVQFAPKVDHVQDDMTSAEFPGYYWMGFTPSDFPLTDTDGGTISLSTTDCYRVFEATAFLTNSVGALAGVLPSGPLSDDGAGGEGAFLVGGGREGGSVTFQGELDEVRITALPNGVVAADTWPAGAQAATVQHWRWYNGVAELRDGAYDPLGSVPLGTTGGYFVLENYLYSYMAYDADPVSPTFGQLQGVRRVFDDLEPAAVLGLGTDHSPLHRIVFLGFLECTRIASIGYAAGGDVPVEDAAALPAGPGYVRIGGEVVGYESLDTSGSPHYLVRNENANGVSSLPRGAYNTGPPVAHADDDLVRHVPVRRADLYRAGRDPVDADYPWDEHVKYDAGQLAGGMCMLEMAMDAKDSRVRTVTWEFRRPLESGQKVTVLVNLDPGAVPWNTKPDDLALDELASGPSGDVLQRALTSDDLFWGTTLEGANLKEGRILLQYWTGSDLTVPTAPGRIEVRFYLDLGTTNVYRFSFDPVLGGVQADGPVSVVELDSMGIEIVPESALY